MTPEYKQQIREKIEDNDRIYQNLLYLHKQEHYNDGCFCTTEISAAYTNIIYAIESLIKEAIHQLITDEVLGVLEELRMKDRIQYWGNGKHSKSILIFQIWKLRFELWRDL